MMCGMVRNKTRMDRSKIGNAHKECLKKSFQDRFHYLIISNPNIIMPLFHMIHNRIIPACSFALHLTVPLKNIHVFNSENLNKIGSLNKQINKKCC